MAPPPSVITRDAPAAPAVTAVTAVSRVVATRPTVPAATTIAFGRTMLVVTLATVGALWPNPTTRAAAAFYLWGLVWLPWAVVLLFAAHGERRRLVGVGGFVGDIV